jgi:hypothetical protein
LGQKKQRNEWSHVKKHSKLAVEKMKVTICAFYSRICV